MKKYKLGIRIRHNMQDRHVEYVDIDTQTFAEFIRLKELSVFNPEAYLTFTLEELPEPEDVSADE